MQQVNEYCKRIGGKTEGVVCKLSRRDGLTTCSIGMTAAGPSPHGPKVLDHGGGSDGPLNTVQQMGILFTARPRGRIQERGQLKKSL
jgi:hypothetical protein